MGFFSTPNERLLAAAKKGDHAGVVAAIKAGANVNAADVEQGRTPLAWAIERGHLGDLKALEELLSKGADVHVRSVVSRDAPIHRAAYFGRVPSLRMLLDAGADVNTVDGSGRSPLHVALSKGNLESARLLLSRGANKNLKDTGGVTPLHVAARLGNDSCVKLMLEAGADVKATDATGKVPFDVVTDPAIKVIFLTAANAGGTSAASPPPPLPPPPPPPPPSAAPALVPAPSAERVLRPVGPKVALCVGISAYKGCNPLKNAARDAEDVGNALRGKGYDVRLLLDGKASYKGMRESLDAFASALRPGGVAFFYFSGHGMRGADGRNYLLPVEGVTHYRDLSSDALSLERINDRLVGSRCLLHVVVSDACRSDAPRMVSETRDELPKGFSILPATPAAAGSVMAYSCEPGKVSWDGIGGGRNGVFTASLLRHLTKDGEHVEHVFTRTTADCVAATKHLPQGEQRPWKHADLTETHVCLF